MQNNEDSMELQEIQDKKSDISDEHIYKKKESKSKLLFERKNDNDDNNNQLKFNSFMSQDDVSMRKTVFDQQDDNDEGEGFRITKNIYDKESEKKRGIQKLIYKTNYAINRISFYLYSNFYFVLIVNICTLYALFADYLRIILFNKQADIVFDVFVITIICIFSIEIVIYWVVEKNYFLGFYFYLDIITTIFLIFDITSISNKVFYQNQNSTTQFLKEISKIVRLIRLIRVLKLFKRREIDNSATLQKVANKNSIQTKKKKESKVTRKLKDLNIKRLIILILLMLITVPLFEYSLWAKQTQFTLQNNYNFIVPQFIEYQDKQQTILKNIQDNFQQYKEKLVYLNIKNIYEYSYHKLDKLRPQEIQEESSTYNYKNINYDIVIIKSIRREIQIQNILDFLNTIFVCLILLSSIYLMNKDFSQLILNPLERMIEKMKEVSYNPLKAMKNKYNLQSKGQMNETYMIEQAIQKISELLILGFGQAGAQIISHFLFDPDKDFDQIIPGQKTYAIFGFCDIRQFTDTTEILLEEVMVFVNEIAQIVHSQVNKYGGAANKNIGDAFLLVWKLMFDFEETKKLTINSSNEKSDPGFNKIKKSHFNRQLAELSLLSFVEIIIDIETKQQILKYSDHTSLKKKLPNYKVKMGFGLHVGWAIEGAIGSSYKIDASYLSPNVNMASRLEAATKQFGVPILFTGELFDMFNSISIKKRCRHIDTVTVKGSIQPLRLYTIDLNIKNLKPENESNTQFDCSKIQALKIDIRDTLQSKFGLISKKIRTIEEEHKKIQLEQKMKLQSFEEDNFLNEKLKSKNFQRIFEPEIQNFDEFKTNFNFGIDCYLKGQWSKAQKFLDRSLLLCPEDGPCKVIFEYMKSMNFQSPDNWKNCRELVDK